MSLLVSKVFLVLFFLSIIYSIVGIINQKDYGRYWRLFQPYQPARTTLGLRDGSPCIGKHNNNGTCIDYRRCPTYQAIYMDYGTEPPICSYNGKIPIVCCTDCFFYNMTYALEVHDELNRLIGRTGVKHFDKCIQNYNKLDYPCKRHTSVPFTATHLIPYLHCIGIAYSGVLSAGEEDAKRSEFPHMALLGYGEDLKSAQWLCEGSLISEKFIMTAAHCRSDPIMGPVKFVALGMLKRSDPVDLWDIYNVKRFIPHPEYASPNKYHDIALIETEGEVNFTKSVLPACIAGNNDIINNYHVKSQETASITSWGALRNRSQTADVLQKVELQQFTELECTVQYSPQLNLSSGYNHATQMCYGVRTKRSDTCGGPRGGPLQVRSAQEECLPMVIGVTSYRSACGLAGSTGIYTRVSNYVPWIEDIVWP